MSDSMDDHQLHMSKPERPSKYGQCDHCGMAGGNPGKCPFCEKGEVR